MSENPVCCHGENSFKVVMIIQEGIEGPRQSKEIGNTYKSLDVIYQFKDKFPRINLLPSFNASHLLLTEIIYKINYLLVQIRLLLNLEAVPSLNEHVILTTSTNMNRHRHRWNSESGLNNYLQ